MTTYAEVNGTTLIQYPYGLAQLQADNPFTNYGPNPDIAALYPLTTKATSTGNTLAPVTIATQPVYNPAVAICTLNAAPTLISSVWTLGWTVVAATALQQIAIALAASEATIINALNQGNNLFFLAPSITSPTTFTVPNSILVATNPAAVPTLPTAVGIQGQVFIFKNASGSPITPLTTSGQTIDGASPAPIPSGGSIGGISDGANWQSLFNVTPTFTGGTLTTSLTIAAGSASAPSFLSQSGPLSTVASAGSEEYDGAVFYATPTANCRGLIPTEQFICLSSPYTLTSQTAAQKIFNSTANGALTLPVGTFEFECAVSLSSLSSTSGSFGFALGGTWSGTQSWFAQAEKGTAGTAAATFQTYGTAANTILVTANVSTASSAIIKGIIRVTSPGTVIPQVSLTIAAAAVVGVNSFFKIKPIGSATATTVGAWS